MNTNLSILYLLILAAVVAITWQWFTFRRSVRWVGVGLFIGLTIALLAQFNVSALGDSQLASTLQSLWVVITVTLTARLLQTTITRPPGLPRISANLAVTAVLLALVGALIVQAAVWDEMEDGLSAIGLWYAVILAGIIAAVLWYLEKTPKRYAPALFVVCLFLAGYGTVLFGSSLSALQLTVESASVTHAALLKYRDETGDYPGILSELTPQYVFPLPQPMLMRGKSWCYETTGKTYRFGYIHRPGFGALASVRVVGAEGIDPAQGWACADDAEHYNQSLANARASVPTP